MRTPRQIMLAGLCIALAAQAALAYIDMPAENLTMPRLLLEFRSAGIYRIERLDLERGAARLQLVRAIAGTNAPQIKQVIRLGERVPEHLRALAVGQQVVLLGDDPYGRSVTFSGGAWHLCTWDRNSGWWLIGYTDRHYDFNCAFVGGVAEMVETIELLLRGSDVTVQCRKKGRNRQTQWVRYTLRRPHEKTIVPGPAQTQPVSAALLTVPLDGLLASFQHVDPAQRVDALREIARRGNSAAAEPAILSLLQADADPFVRRACAAALAQTAGAPPRVIPVLLTMLKHGYSTPEALLSSESAAAIRLLDPEARLTVPTIASMLKDPQAAVRSRGAVAATLLGTHAKAAAASLIDTLRDPEPDVRYQSAVALRHIEADPLLAAPALARCLADANRDVLDPVTRALVAMAPESVDAVARTLSDGDVQARRLAAGVLAEIGPPARPALSALRRAAEDRDPRVQAEAARAIQRIQR